MNKGIKKKVRCYRNMRFLKRIYKKEGTEGIKNFVEKESYLFDNDFKKVLKDFEIKIRARDN